MAKDFNETVLFQPHDGLFKSTMQNLDVAREVVCGYFPQEQVQLMNLNTMHLESSDFLGDDLKQSHADILYSIETKEGPGYIYTLLEHQSSPDPKMPLRTLDYEVQIMRRHLNAGHKKLPLVFTMVIYAGDKSPYPETTDLYEMFQNPELAKQFMFKPFKLVDLTTMPEEEIAQWKNPALLLLALKLRASGQTIQLSQKLTALGLAEYLRPKIDTKYLVSVISYILDDPNISDRNSLIESIKALGKNAEEIAMSLAQKLTQQGRKEGMYAGELLGIQKGELLGMEKGREEGRQEIARSLLSNGLDGDLVAKSTGLDIKLIRKLKKETVK